MTQITAMLGEKVYFKARMISPRTSGIAGIGALLLSSQLVKALEQNLSEYSQSIHRTTFQSAGLTAMLC